MTRLQQHHNFSCPTMRNGTVHISYLHAIIHCLIVVLSSLRLLVNRMPQEEEEEQYEQVEQEEREAHLPAHAHCCDISPLPPSHLRAIKQADACTRAQAWSSQAVGTTTNASGIPAHHNHSARNMIAKTSHAKAERRANGVMVPGDCVMITWDRYWHFHRRTSHMVKTPYEGRKGTVIRMTECFVWVKLDDTYELLQKKKHNVKIVAGEN